jgi:hypothetical protein
MQDRKTLISDLDTAKKSQELVDAIRIHYNFIRPHQAIGNQTPAEAAGINLQLGENKVENLMRQAAIRQKENNTQKFMTELGIRVNKLQILRKDDCIEIKPKDWLDKKNWREINEILVKHGFSWLSYGKDSCWLLSKE